MSFRGLDERPLVLAIAGPNGAGKTTFYHSHVAKAGLRFVNADVLARELSLDPYAAARVADAIRRELVQQRVSFVFETVFSDPVADKLQFLQQAAGEGYSVVLCYVGIGSPRVSEQRVAMRVSQGGHDVPTDKLKTRFPRTLDNLRRAIRDVPHVLVFDNDDLQHPFRHVATFENGKRVLLVDPVPKWLRPIIK